MTRDAARTAGTPPSSSSSFTASNEPFSNLHKPDLNGVLALADGELDEGGAAAPVGETARHVAAHATNDRAAIANPVRAAGARLAGV